MPDITPAYQWTLSLLHASSTKLPQPTILPYLNSALRYFLALAPDVASAYSTDSLDDDSLALLNEAIGYRAVSQWLMTPPAPGFETLLRQELSPGLVEQYQGWQPERISQAMVNHADSRFSSIDLVGEASLGRRATRRWTTRATPTKTANMNKANIYGRIFKDADDGEF